MAAIIDANTPPTLNVLHAQESGETDAKKLQRQHANTLKSLDELEEKIQTTQATDMSEEISRAKKELQESEL
jgi:hypothetical protein